MERKFRVVIEKRQDEYEARCKELPEVIAHGRDKEGALEIMKALIIKKLGGDSDGDSAPGPHPVSPAPHAPIIVEVAREKPAV
jgi:hypothetical protein